MVQTFDIAQVEKAVYEVNKLKVFVSKLIR